MEAAIMGQTEVGANQTTLVSKAKDRLWISLYSKMIPQVYNLEIQGFKSTHSFSPLKYYGVEI